MKKVEYKNFTIEFTEEGSYPFNSKDKKTIYEKIYLNDEDDGKYSFFSSYGIRVSDKNKEVSKCLIAALGWGSRLQNNSYIIESDKIVICSSNSVFCLSLPNLNLEWKTKADDSECFQILKLQDDYLIHGEIEISRIARNGEILWQTSGRDIFVTINGRKDIFEIHSDHILVSDFENTVYKIDLDGNHIDEFKL